MARTGSDTDDGETLDGADICDRAPEPADDEDDGTHPSARMRNLRAFPYPCVRQHGVSQVRRRQH